MHLESQLGKFLWCFLMPLTTEALIKNETLRKIIILWSTIFWYCVTKTKLSTFSNLHSRKCQGGGKKRQPKWKPKALVLCMSTPTWLWIISFLTLSQIHLLWHSKTIAGQKQHCCVPSEEFFSRVQAHVRCLERSYVSKIGWCSIDADGC